MKVPFLLVTGGKGGVGKTTVAANLGVALGRLGHGPRLVDLDFGLANLDIMLGVTAPQNVGDYFAGRRSLDECFFEGPGGTQVLSGGAGSYERRHLEPSQRARLMQAIHGLEGGIVVGDSPAGIGDDVLDFAVQAQRVLVVTTPEPAAVTDAYGVIKAIDAFATENHLEAPTPELFINQARDAAEAQAIADKLAGICERFLARSPRAVGWMPRSRAVQRAVLNKEAFLLSAPDTPASKNLSRLARRYGTLNEFLPPRVSDTKALVSHDR